MRAIIVSTIFHPDIAANAKRMRCLAEALHERGHEVAVLTSFPHYPHGIVPQEYRGKTVAEEVLDGIRVIRTYTYASPNKTFRNRLLNFLSIMLSAPLGVPRLESRWDVVVAISPSLPSAIMAYAIAKLKGAALVYDLEDIYPETAIVLNMLRNPVMIATSKALEKLVYHCATKIAVISKGFKANLRNKGVPDHKIEIVSNWTDPELFNSRDGKMTRERYGWTNKFVVMFVGTIGLAQGAEHIVEAARLLSHVPDIQFVFLGAGVEKPRLEALVNEYGLRNVIFLPPRSHEEVPDFLSAADACLVHLRRNSLFAITIPSKTYEYMGMGRPIIMGVEGEAAELVQEAQCGIPVGPENPEAIAQGIVKLYTDPELCSRLGQNGRSFALANYTKDKVLERYLDVLEYAAKL